MYVNVLEVPVTEVIQRIFKLIVLLFVTYLRYFVSAIKIIDPVFYLYFFLAQ